MRINIVGKTGIKIAVIYLLAIITAEVITIYVHLVWGVACHALVLAAAVVHAAVIKRETVKVSKNKLVELYRQVLLSNLVDGKGIAGDTQEPLGSFFYRRLILSLALVPLVRIISLSMPIADIPQIWQYPIIYTPLLVAIIVVVRILGYKRREVGLFFNLSPVQFAVGLSGLLFAVVEYLILKPELVISELTWQSVWLPALIFLVFTGFVEEFMFRGVLQRAAAGAFREWWGIIYVSLLFAAMHMGYKSLIDVIFVFLVALFFGWVVKKTGSLFGVTLAHGITNIGLYLILPALF